MDKASAHTSVRITNSGNRDHAHDTPLLISFKFSVRGPNALLARGTDDREHQIVAQIASELNKWFDSVPEHRMFMWMNVRLTITYEAGSSSLEFLSGRFTLFSSIWPPSRSFLSTSNNGSSTFCFFEKITRFLIFYCPSDVHQCSSRNESYTASDEHSTSWFNPVCARMFSR
jgi:hypothetical protein